LSGKGGLAKWWRAIPPGFELVPTGTIAGRGPDSKVQTPGGGERGMDIFTCKVKIAFEEKKQREMKPTQRSAGNSHRS